MRILIIRHGDPDYQNDSLTSKGKREATLLAERLKSEEITAFYSSPLGRAKETCEYVARAKGVEQDVQVKDWLREFEAPVRTPVGREKHSAWDMIPEEWLSEDILYDHARWFDHPCYQGTDIKKEYTRVVTELDKLLALHGYVREGKAYRAERPNRDTIALFCHFGVESVLLSRLWNVSPINIWHHFVALPSSVTTLYTEERREGKAVFRCAGFGDIGHLYAGAEPPSFAARFCETYHSDERHD